MVEHWEKALDAKDPTTLRAKLGEAKKWMEGYSHLDQGLARQGVEIPIPGVQGGTPLVSTQAEFDALPKGSTYKEPNGKTYTKP